jgi:hypothetical protein
MLQLSGDVKLVWLQSRLNLVACRGRLGLLLRQLPMFLRFYLAEGEARDLAYRLRGTGLTSVVIRVLVVPGFSAD